MSRKTPRPYQAAAIEETLLALRDQPVLVAPTGAGKTFMGAEIVARTGARTLWIAHRRELVHQAAGALRDAGLRCGVVLSGEDEDAHAPVQVASVQTLARRELPDADLLVVDEAHHATSSGYARLLARFSLRLGLTATPFRLDGRGLRTAGFNRLVVAAYTDDLCADGTLHEPAVYTAPSVDLSAVKKTAGDYNLRELAAAVGGAALNGRIVETWKKKAEGRRTVAFAVDIAHAETIVRSFRDAGVVAEIVTGDTPKAERDGVLARLAHGLTTIVVNVGVLTEGWDLPALECAIVARPTASLCLHLQQIGRIMRSCEGKEGAIVLDHAGNYDRHGLVTDRLVYSLDGKVKKAGGVAPTKTCPECARVIAAGVHVCPECGHLFPREDKTKENDAELLPVGHGDPFDERARRWARFYTEASRIASWKFHGDMFSTESKGLGFTIASQKFKARYGCYPLAYDARLLDPRTATSADWAHMRERWREIGARKGWPAHTTEWFVRKCEAEARGGKVGAA